MIINLTGVSGSRVAYLISKEIKNYNSTLIVVSSGLVADRLREDISFFVPDISVQALPEKEDFHFLYEARDKDELVRRIRGMESLAGTSHDVVIVPISALLPPVDEKAHFLKYRRMIRLGDEVDPDELKNFLVQAGYEYNSVTSAPGEFSGRGDIIDVYSPSMENPVRIEFFDTEIDSLRTFDPVSQRSVESISQFQIVPAVEFMPEPEAVEKALARIEKEYRKRIDELKEQREKENLKDGRIERYEEELGRIREMFRNRTNLPIFSEYISYFDVPETRMWNYMDNGLVLVYDPARIGEAIPEYQDKDSFLRMYRECENIRITTPFPERIEGLDRLDEIQNIESRPVAPFNGQLQMLASSVRGYLKKGYEVHLVSSTEERGARLREYLDEGGVHGNLLYDTGNLSAGLILEEERLCRDRRKLFAERKRNLRPSISRIFRRAITWYTRFTELVDSKESRRWRRTEKRRII